MVLIGTDLRQRLHTERPFGAPLPPTNSPEAVRRAVETGRPAVSGLRTGAVMGVPVASVVVPVVREGRAVAALSAPVAPARLSRLLAEQGLAGGAFATAMDGGHTIVARSARADEFVGRRAPEWVVRAVEAGSGGGLVEGRTLTGEPVVAVFHRLRLAPEWVIAVGAPRAAYAESARRPLVALAVGGAATLLLALACAAWLGRRILRPVRALERQAEAVAATEGIAGPPPELRST